MAFDSSLLTEDEEPKSGFDPSLLVDDDSEARSAKRERLKAEMAEARKVPISQRLLETAGALGDYVVDPVSKMNPLTVIPRAAFGAGQVAGIVPANQPFPLDEDKPLMDLQQALVNPVVEAGSLVDELRYGGQQALADVGQFFVTPRGISALAAGGAPRAAQAALASGFAGSMAAAVPEAYEATEQAFQGDSTSDKARAALGLAATVAAPLAIAGGALKQGMKPAERIVAEPAIERIPDASQVRETAEVHGDVRPPAQEIPQEVPAQVSGERVPAPTGQELQTEVLLNEAKQIEGQAQPGVGETGQIGQEAGMGVQTNLGRPERISGAERGATTEAEVASTPVSLAHEPSGQSLGIVPPGSGKLIEIIDKAVGKPKEAGPAIVTDASTPLPDFQPHATSKKIFSQPFGFENLPVIGALFGGTRRLAGHVNESLSTYWAERQIGRSIASAFGSEHSWLDKPFTIKDGQITNITSAKEGASRYISDVFEALQKDPESYRLNAEQKKAFDAIQKLEKDFSKLEEKYKIGKEIDDEITNPVELLDDTDVTPKKGAYFPRIVTARPEGVTSGLTRGSSVGAKAFFEKSRLFGTEAEGWSKGYKYEPSIVNRLATRTERLYKRIADKRLSSDPALEGVSRKEVESQLRASFAEELADGSMSDKKIAQMADSIEARGRVYAPAFFNKIFPEATANQLNKAFPKSQSSLRQTAASINNAIKGVQLGLDLGVGFIQGQALLARHPTIWAKAQFNSLRAMFHREQFPEYVRSNLEPVRELAQLGSGVGRLEEYMAGMGGKELLGKVPGVKAFGRQFQTFLDVAKVEMWKAFRETTPKEQWSDVAQTIESVLSSGRMEGIGVSQSRALAERALLLAPSYYRGGLNMIAAMAEKGVSGQIARNAMVAYATSGAVLFYGVAKALGMSDDEILQRMNPARSDFMLWRIKTKNHISNVGFGGFYRSLLRLMGNTAKTSIDNPGNWASLSPDKNPITKWYRGHAGPVVTTAWDGFSGKDYMGQDTDISSILRRSVTPITLQSAKGKPGQPTPSAAESAGSFVGLQSFPSTSKTELNKLHSEWLANNRDPKVKADYERDKARPREQSKYAMLFTTLMDKDQKAATQAIKDLQAEGVKRSDIYKRMSPYTASGEAQKPLFNESAALEAKFTKSLTPEQKKLYEEAKADRKEQWQLFLKAYRGK
jgi:hypothetical protein